MRWIRRPEALEEKGFIYQVFFPVYINSASWWIYVGLLGVDQLTPGPPNVTSVRSKGKRIFFKKPFCTKASFLWFFRCDLVSSKRCVGFVFGKSDHNLLDKKMHHRQQKISMSLPQLNYFTLFQIQSAKQIGNKTDNDRKHRFHAGILSEKKVKKSK